MQLLMKPGGHGVIWKLARDEGVFEWLFSLGRKKALVRQINNPMAGCDHGLLAFSGVGCKENKLFGFASCERQVKASEGINILIEREEADTFEYTLTNIEYCDFQKFNIPDEPAESGSSYSKFSSNTNILFIDLAAVDEMVAKYPLPGMLVNLKPSTYKTFEGKIVEEEIARLESTMQNIADCFSEKFAAPLEAEESSQLKTYLTFNERRKTISTVKKEYTTGSSLLETPEGCFLDMMLNARELLEDYCDFKLPLPEMYLQPLSRPAFIFQYHPALGPLYSIIAQKIRSGSISVGSELKLEIAEADFNNVHLAGSLLVQAESILGHSHQGLLQYSEGSGKCTLRNVTIRNQGIDFDAANCFWKDEICRKEACRILLKGNGEFYAEDVLLEGDLTIEVQPNTRVIASMANGKLHLKEETITKPTWFWKYTVDGQERIFLTRLHSQ